jgi:hypothetical protein
MTDYPFTDADCRDWLVMDYSTEFDPQNPTVRIEKRVPLGSSKATARAFVPPALQRRSRRRHGLPLWVHARPRARDRLTTAAARRIVSGDRDAA